jgi:hypothetical protein
MTDGEEWRPVPGWEDIYEVSNHGRVRSRRVGRYSGRVLAACAGPGGYRAVQLYRDGMRQQAYVHTLVALTFHGPRPAGLQIRHLDGNQLNNRPENLCYGTAAENAADTYRHGYVKGGRREAVAEALGCDVLEYLAAARAEGKSWRRIERAIWDATRGKIDVTAETLRAWAS